MAVRYLCAEDGRRSAVIDDATLNGIDFLEVLDQDAPPGSPRQRTLLVHCFKPIPALSADNVAIGGGVRITPIRVEWAFSAPSVPSAAASQAERDLFAGLPGADQVLVVRTDSAGDFSTYTLSIVPSAADTSLTDAFDPELSSVDFSFKVECPSDFDCVPAPEGWPARPPEPDIDYLAKDYSSFRRLMLDRLALLLPGWAERNPADVGVALVEVLAAAADELSYHQDAVATEAYLGTARRRTSVRRHARLLDYVLHDGVNARVWVCLGVDQGSPADGNEVVPAGTLVVTGPGADAVLRTDQVPPAVAAGAQVFETLHDVTLHATHAEIRFHTWGDSRCVLPAGAVEATFRNEAGGLALVAGDVVVFEEVIGPETGDPVDADPSRRHAVRLTRVTPRVDPVGDIAVVDVEWDPADRPGFAFTLSTVVTDEAGERPVTDLTVARGNVVLGDHGLTVPAEPLDPPPVSSDGAPYRPRLARQGLTSRVPYVHETAIAGPASEAILQDPRRALPDVSLDERGKPWTARLDLLASDRFARDFVVETEDDGSATLRFGDGVLGQRPAGGTSLVATYRVGNGRAGNVGAESLVHVAPGPLGLPGGISGVRNPLPATGGTDPEPTLEARMYAPQAFRTQQRAVTEEDYATMAERHPEVQRAVATFRWTGSWRTVFVTVDRVEGRPVDEPFVATIRDFLEPFRMAGEDLEVEGPEFVPLDVALTVCVDPAYFAGPVEQALLQAFSNGLLPDGRRGFFHPDNFTFGRPVYLSQVVATAMAVPGVQWVDADDTPPKPNRFGRFGQASRGEVAAGRIDLDRLEIARLDNDPSAPENGRIRFFMEGGL